MKVSAKRVVVTSFFVDLLDVGLNTTVMIFSGSVVMLAEALEGGSDLIASGLLLIGLRTSKRQANPTHPFGHGKEIYFWTLLSATVMLIFAAGLSFYFGLDRLLHPKPLSNIFLAYGALCLAVVTNGYALKLSMSRLLEGQKIQALLKQFRHSYNVETKNTFILDLTGTLSALLGLLSLLLYQLTGLHHFDGLGGMIIAILIAISSLILIWGIKDFLIGKRAAFAVEKKIEKAALQVNHVKGVIGLNTMQLGNNILVHMGIALDQGTEINEGQTIISRVKEHIKKTVPTVSVIQLEIKTSDKPISQSKNRILNQ